MQTWKIQGKYLYLRSKHWKPLLTHHAGDKFLGKGLQYNSELSNKHYGCFSLPIGFLLAVLQILKGK